MSLESRIRELERRRNSKDQSHVHWMVPNPLGGMIAPNPKDCEACQASDYENRFIVAFNMRSKDLIAPSHVRR